MVHPQTPAPSLPVAPAKVSPGAPINPMGQGGQKPSGVLANGSPQVVSTSSPPSVSGHGGATAAVVVPHPGESSGVLGAASAKDPGPAAASNRGADHALQEFTTPLRYDSLDAAAEVHVSPAAQGFHLSRVTPTVAEQLASGVLARAEITTQEGRTDFHLRLQPPELGPVSVHLSTSAQGITARLVVQEESARQLIQSQLESLRQRLAESGVSLGRCDVSRDGSGSQDPRQQAAPSAPAPAEPERPEQVVSSPAARQAPPGGIDVIV
jgi:flagellar hook-length control protein FliK